MNKELDKIRRKRAEELMRGPFEASYPSRPEKLTDSTFDEYVKKYPMVVVDCHADWCMPCRMVSPIIEELAGEMGGRVAFGKLNVDENQMVAMKYGIMSIPTLLVFKNGTLIDQIIGAMPKAALKSRVEGY